MSIFKKIAEKLKNIGLPILAQAAGKGNPLVGAIIQTLTGKPTVEEAADAIPDQLTGEQALAWQQAELAHKEALLAAEVDTFREAQQTARTMIQSDDRFVRWQIPGILFTFNIAIFWNQLVAPLGAFFCKVAGGIWGLPELLKMEIVTVPIPGEFFSMVGVLLLGLLGKKLFDNNDIEIGALGFKSPARKP